jgi:ubiquilin
MEENMIKITLRQNSGSQFDIEVNSKGTVRDLKEACVEKAGIPADEMRLIFKGKIITHECAALLNLAI